MKDELLKSYHKVDGIYEVPVEVFDDLIDDYKTKKLVIDNLIIRVTNAIDYINNLEYFTDDDENSNDSYYKCNNIDDLLSILEGDK